MGWWRLKVNGFGECNGSSQRTPTQLFFIGEFATNQGENRGERWVSGVYGEGEGEGEGVRARARAR